MNQYENVSEKDKDMDRLSRLDLHNPFRVAQSKPSSLVAVIYRSIP
jgi:hypothetical protein